MIEMNLTQKQVEAGYHSRILRIPHGKQNPTKKYLTEEQVLDLFDGTVVIHEKVDGKLDSIDETTSISPRFMIIEDMNNKHTIHKHVMKYDCLPIDKKIVLDYVYIHTDNTLKICPCKFDQLRIGTYRNMLLVAKLNINTFREGPKKEQYIINQIYQILEILSKTVSAYGSDKIEGLVIKNYKKQLFGKWINDEFEDKIKESKKHDKRNNH